MARTSFKGGAPKFTGSAAKLVGSRRWISPAIDVGHSAMAGDSGGGGQHLAHRPMTGGTSRWILAGVPANRPTAVERTPAARRLQTSSAYSRTHNKIPYSLK